MSTAVKLDFSKAVPINSAPQGVTLNFSKAQPIAEGEQINDVGNRRRREFFGYDATRCGLW
jgi:hypothetical protein